MRQVPKIPNYLLIGGGRLARHLAFYLKELSVPYTCWNRNDHSTAELVAHLKSHQYILLCISDDQIPDFYEQFGQENGTYIHFSGTLQHPQIHGFHPLMSFGHKLYALSTYQSIHFVGTADEKIFKSIFPKFNNAYSKINEDQKALYHSLCVLSGNGTTLLWDLINQEFKKMGLPESALHPYLEQVSKNILENHSGRWTGPWYRKDQKTIRHNKAALQDQPLQQLYSEMEKLSKFPREAQ